MQDGKQADPLIHLREQAQQGAQKLHTWTMLLAGQFTGTVPDQGTEYQKGRFLRNLESGRLIRGAEINALSQILIDKGIITEEEWLRAIIDEYRAMDQIVQQEHPGARVVSVQAGVGFAISVDRSKVDEIMSWMADWPK